MHLLARKVLVLLPVCLVAFWFFNQRSTPYAHVGINRLYFLALTLILLFTWFIVETVYRKQRNLIQMFLQSSFFIYVFMVLTLTGYFILFREVSAQDWWSKMQLRIQHRDHVNLTLLQVFKIYKFSDKQVLGNLVMLLPLGIYLPLLYKLGRKPLNVIVISFMASAGIELLQLATRFRSADVDDILLNTLGACMGYVIFAIVRSMTAADGSLYNNNDTPLISTR